MDESIDNRCRGIYRRPPGNGPDQTKTGARQELGWKSRITQDTAMKKINDWTKTRYRRPKMKRENTFDGKVVYITGGSSGIGLAIAGLLAPKGARLVLLARDDEKLENARQEIEKLRPCPCHNIITLSVDVANLEDVNQKMKTAMAAAGTPDILINNAGITDTDYFENISPESFDKVIKVNLYGTRNMIAALFPAMKQRRKGHIVNMASGAALTGIFGYSSYSASKYAVMGLSEVLRSELKPYQISVSVVCPPRVKTPMDEKEAKIIPPETLAVKRLAGCLTAEYVAEIIIKGIAKKKFLIIPGHTMKTLYHLQRYLGAGLFRGTTDFIIKMAKRRAGKK
jgi:3-dehydrosphinganine reductase